MSHRTSTCVAMRAAQSAVAESDAVDDSELSSLSGDECLSELTDSSNDSADESETERGGSSSSSNNSDSDSASLTRGSVSDSDLSELSDDEDMMQGDDDDDNDEELSEETSPGPSTPGNNESHVDAIDTSLDPEMKQRGAARRAAASIASIAPKRRVSSHMKAESLAEEQQPSSRSSPLRQTPAKMRIPQQRQTRRPPLSPREQRFRARTQAAPTPSAKPARTKAKEAEAASDPTSVALATAAAPPSEPPLTERQRHQREEAKRAAELDRQRRRGEKKAALEAKKELKRKERAEYLAYRRKLREELEAEERGAFINLQMASEVGQANPALAHRSAKRHKRNSGAPAAAEVLDSEQVGEAGRRSKKSKKPLLFKKKEATPPLAVPDYLALSPEARSRECLRDVRPAYFYPDRPAVALDDWDEDGIPVFVPTMEQFVDFYAYMSAIDAWGMRSGIVKVIPPKEWVEALPSIRQSDIVAASDAAVAVASLEAVRIRSAIEQNFTMAGSGVWRQTNVVKPAKVWNVKMWADEAAKVHRRGPEMKHMQAKLIHGATYSSSSSSGGCGGDASGNAGGTAAAAVSGVAANGAKGKSSLFHDDIMGARTRSGKIVDGQPSRAAAQHAANEAAKRKKRKREAAAAAVAAAAVAVESQGQGPSHGDISVAVGGGAASTTTAHADIDLSMPALECVPHPEGAAAQAKAGAPSAASDCSSAPVLAVECALADAEPSAGQGTLSEEGKAEPEGEAHTASSNAEVEAAPAATSTAADGKKAVPRLVFRKRSPSMSGKLQPSVMRPLELSTQRMVRSQSMRGEQSLVLRQLRNRDLRGEEIVKTRRKRPEWHPKKLTEADKTPADVWAAFDYKGCWLREAVPSETPAEDAMKEDDNEGEHVDGTAGLVVPIAKDWTPEICRQIEGEYWRGLNGGAAPMYGADQEGTLFTPRTKSWNVGSLDNILTRLRLKGRLPGVTTPYLYLGMWRATFAWHVEDMDLYSINYIHFGAPKQWYAIRQFDRQRFENVMKAAFPQDSGRCSQFMRHKSYLASPTYLRERGIEPLRLVHHAQEFVITYPFGYHSGYNLGFNCAESVNFALEPWLDIGRKANYCHCVDYSVRVNVDALIEESNEMVEAEENAERQRQEEIARAKADEALAEAEAEAEDVKQAAEAAAAAAAAAAAGAAYGEEAAAGPPTITHKEKLRWQREGARIRDEREAIMNEARTDGDMDELAQRAMELRKANAAYQEFQVRLSVQNRLKRQEAQVLRYKKAADDKERMLAEERRKAQEECPCVFCLSRNTSDLVPVAPAPDVELPPGSTAKMAHRSCVPLIQETYIPADGPDVVLGFENIPRDRWKLKCSICRVQYGCCAQCTYGKCTASAHISCAFPDESTASEDKEMPTWLYQSLPANEAKVMNGNAKKAKKSKPSAKLKTPASAQAVMVAGAPAHSSAPEQAAAQDLAYVALSAAASVAAPPSALEQRSAPVPSSIAALPSVPAQGIIAATASAQGSTSVSTSAGVLTTMLQAEPSAAPTPGANSQDANTSELKEDGAEPDEENYTHVFLCPTHNPVWKKVVAERRAAKKLEDNRQRVLALLPGTLVKYRSKSGGVWQAALIEIVDKEGSDGEVIVSEHCGPTRVPWSRIIFPEAERAASKRKDSVASGIAGHEQAHVHKRIKIVSHGGQSGSPSHTALQSPGSATTPQPSALTSTSTSGRMESSSNIPVLAANAAQFTPGALPPQLGVAPAGLVPPTTMAHRTTNTMNGESTAGNYSISYPLYGPNPMAQMAQLTQGHQTHTASSSWHPEMAGLQSTSTVLSQAPVVPQVPGLFPNSMNNAFYHTQLQRAQVLPSTAHLPSATPQLQSPAGEGPSGSSTA